MQITSGVPQGSVLGSMMWNVAFDGVLRLEMPEGVIVTAYADDLAITVTARTQEELKNNAGIAVETVMEWLGNRRMQLAVKKTKPLLMIGRRKIANFEVRVGNTIVTPKDRIKYLGVWLDGSLNFKYHISETALKAEKSVAALTRLIARVRGSRAKKRRVLCNVAESILLYAVPVWKDALRTKTCLARYARVQRTHTGV